MRWCQQAVLVCAATLLGAAPASAQPARAGRVFQPLAHPANPNLVAYERNDGDGRSLVFLHVPSGEVQPLGGSAGDGDAGGFVLPDAAAADRVTAYSGDLDWRPVVDGGRHWFAYVGSSDRGLQLYLQAVDERGRTGGGRPVAVPQGAGARQPRWSPDGRHLLFVAEQGQLMVVANAAEALSKRDARRLAPRPVEAARGTAYFPTWSPVRLGAVAYQVERTTGAARRYVIELVQLNPQTLAASATPFVITGGATTDNLIRPSWSPDGRYVAYYLDRATGQGEEATATLDIGVATIQLSQGTTRIFRTEILAGRSPRLAEAVLPHGSRGPAWTEIASADGTPQAAIAYVQRDDSLNNPVMVAGVERWRGMVPRSQYALNASARWGTANHRDPLATPYRDSVRFAFVAAAAGGERIELRSVHAPWARSAAAVAGGGSGGRAGSGTDPVAGGGGWGVGIALLGSGVQMPAAGVAPAATHLVAQPLLTVQRGRVGIYAAPEVGSGAGYQSLVVGGGVMVRAVESGAVAVHLLAGGAALGVTPGTGAIHPSVSDLSAVGGSLGALVRFRLAGPLHASARGQYVKGLGAHGDLGFKRFAFGVGVRR